MLKLSCKIIALVLCSMFVLPQVHACRGATQESTIFFNANAQPLIFDDLGQPPSNAKGMVEPLPDADVIAEVFLTDLNQASPIATATANVVRVIKTSDARVRQGEKVAIKFKFTSCGPNHRNGSKGIMAAKVGADIEGRLVLCPYLRRFGDGRIDVPSMNECLPGEMEAAKKISLAAEKGDVKAQIALGLMYEKGKSVRANNAVALKWFRSAAESGDAEAQYELGKKYQRDRNGNKAMQYLRLAAAQGHAEAMYLIGWTYEYGSLGIKQSMAKAVEWHGRAAEQGHDDAKRRLRELKEAEPLLLAAKKGDAEAQGKLGQMYRRRNDAEAVKWLKRAAAQGDIRAMNELGDMYQVGSGVTQNYAEAVKWYRLGAEQGDAESQVDLGQMYRVYAKDICGDSPHDCLRNAVEWYRRAAEQGNSRGQYHLGGMYQQGSGIEKNDAEAVKWYRLAAAQGQMLVKDFLAEMYLQGRGVDENDAEMVKWLRHAAENGNDRAKAKLKTLQK